MADVFIIANDALLLHRLKPLIDDMSEEGLSVMTAESETRASHGGAEEIIRDMVMVISSVVLTKEYERIKDWLRDWFTEHPHKRDSKKPDLYVRIEDPSRKLIERIHLTDD